MHQTENGAANIGAINPYALAELVLQKPINWNVIHDKRSFLEKTLQTKYQDLFDPQKSSLLFFGPKRAPEKETALLRSIKPMVLNAGNGDTTPPGSEWKDIGTFFDEAAEFFDPVQGAVANCYFIASLASVAWARPYVVAQRTRATGNDNESFMNMVEFFRNGTAEKYEVSDKINVNSNSQKPMYARSSEAGEIWPSIYEKAFAKYDTGYTGDKPNVAATAFGSTIGALETITGLKRQTFKTVDLTADQIYQTVRENCISYKTFNPMAAWTYGSGANSPDNVDYGDANLVANHAYSILGWHYANGMKYIVLRNPWGSTEASVDTFNGTWGAHDAPYYGGPGWWRGVNTALNDGTFVLRVETFKKYFAGFGVVK